MTAVNSFTFSGYTLRPANEADLPLARMWTLADVYHREITPPSFWVEQRPGRDSFLLIDASGPIFFFKIHATRWAGLTDAMAMKPSEVELHIQFMPDTDAHDRRRLREGLLQGMAWLERILRLSGVHRICFDSRNPELIRFCRKRLGFDISGERLSRAL